MRLVPLPTAVPVQRVRGLPVAAPSWCTWSREGGGGRRPPRSPRCVAPSWAVGCGGDGEGETVVGSSGGRVAAFVRKGWTDEEAIVTERPPKMRRKIYVSQKIAPVRRRMPQVLLLTSWRPAGSFVM